VSHAAGPQGFLIVNTMPRARIAVPTTNSPARRNCSMENAFHGVSPMPRFQLGMPRLHPAPDVARRKRRVANMLFGYRESSPAYRNITAAWRGCDGRIVHGGVGPVTQLNRSKRRVSRAHAGRMPDLRRARETPENMQTESRGWV